MKIYLVTTILNDDSEEVLSIFASDQDAHAHLAASKTPGKEDCYIEERTLFYGQPPRPGYNQ